MRVLSPQLHEYLERETARHNDNAELGRRAVALAGVDEGERPYLDHLKSGDDQLSEHALHERHIEYRDFFMAALTMVGALDPVDVPEHALSMLGDAVRELHLRYRPGDLPEVEQSDTEEAGLTIGKDAQLMIFQDRRGREWWVLWPMNAKATKHLNIEKGKKYFFLDRLDNTTYSDAKHAAQGLLSADKVAAPARASAAEVEQSAKPAGRLVKVSGRTTKKSLPARDVTIDNLYVGQIIQIGHSWSFQMDEKPGTIKQLNKSLGSSRAGSEFSTNMDGKSFYSVTDFEDEADRTAKFHRKYASVDADGAEEVEQSDETAAMPENMYLKFDETPLVGTAYVVSVFAQDDIAVIGSLLDPERGKMKFTTNGYKNVNATMDAFDVFMGVAHDLERKTYRITGDFEREAGKLFGKPDVRRLLFDEAETAMSKAAEDFFQKRVKAAGLVGEMRNMLVSSKLVMPFKVIHVMTAINKLLLSVVYASPTGGNMAKFKSGATKAADNLLKEMRRDSFKSSTDDAESAEEGAGKKPEGAVDTAAVFRVPAEQHRSAYEVALDAIKYGDDYSGRKPKIGDIIEVHDEYDDGDHYRLKVTAKSRKQAMASTETATRPKSKADPAKPFSAVSMAVFGPIGDPDDYDSPEEATQGDKAVVDMIIFFGSASGGLSVHTRTAQRYARTYVDKLNAEWKRNWKKALKKSYGYYSGDLKVPELSSTDTAAAGKWIKDDAWHYYYEVGNKWTHAIEVLSRGVYQLRKIDAKKGAFTVKTVKVMGKFPSLKTAKAGVTEAASTETAIRKRSNAKSGRGVEVWYEKGEDDVPTGWYWIDRNESDAQGPWLTHNQAKSAAKNKEKRPPGDRLAAKRSK